MSSSIINVGLFCRILPHYRLPVFEKLAKAADIDLMVYYSREPIYSSLKTIDPVDRFPNRRIEMKALRLAGQEILFQPDIGRIIRNKPHDVIVLSGNFRMPNFFPDLLAAKRRNIGVVWWTQGIKFGASQIGLAAKSWVMRIPDAVLLYTDYEKNWAISRGIPEAKVFATGNTIDVTADKQAASCWSDRQLKEFIQAKGLTQKKIFLFCGQLRPIKRMDILLKALQILHAENSDYHLVVVGGSPFGTKLKELGSKMGLSQAITWLGKIYDPAELAPWFLSAKALVVPRAIGLAAFHGFAYGLPCITSANRYFQSPEVAALKHGQNCLLCRDNDIQDLADKMRLIVDDNRLQTKLSFNATSTLEIEYTLDKMVDGFLQAIFYAANATNYKRSSFKERNKN